MFISFYLSVIGYRLRVYRFSVYRLLGGRIKYILRMNKLHYCKLKRAINGNRFELNEFLCALAAVIVFRYLRYK